MKRKILILTLLFGIPGAMIFARFVLRPVNVSASSVRDDQIAVELRSELSRIYLKRFAYPKTLDSVWADPEFIAILELSFLPTDRASSFAYTSDGETYEVTYTNGNKLVIERGIRGIPSRHVVKVGDPIPLANTNAP